MSQDYFELKGKTALITGASSGLGAHFAGLLASEGVHVIIAARRTDRLAEQLERIKSEGVRPSHSHGRNGQRQCLKSV